MTVLNIYVKHTVWFLRPTFCSPSAAMVTCLYMNELLAIGTKNVIIQSVNHSIIQLIFQASAQNHITWVRHSITSICEEKYWGQMVAVTLCTFSYSHNKEMSNEIKISMIYMNCIYWIIQLKASWYAQILCVTSDVKVVWHVWKIIGCINFTTETPLVDNYSRNLYKKCRIQFTRTFEGNYFSIATAVCHHL